MRYLDWCYAKGKAMKRIKDTRERISSSWYLSTRLWIIFIVTSSCIVAVLCVFATGIFDWKIQEYLTESRGDSNCDYEGEVNLAGYFSENYSLARKRFIDAGTLAGANMSRFVLEDVGPSGELLSVDIAWLGNLAPKRVLLHTSGLHGVEGFAGSAIQLKLLENAPRPPEDSAIIFMHILNPYGMAWLRRYNESNVDLNRNFRFREEAWQVQSDVYQQIHSFLNPESEKLFDSFLLQAAGALTAHKYSTLKQAIAEGQNQFPKGLFYAGKHLEKLPVLYGAWLAESFSLTQHLFVIDVHTGLGSRCQESLVHKVRATDSARLSKMLGKSLQQDFVKESGGNTEFRGGHNHLYKQVLPHVEIDFVTQEFGTYPNLFVLQALRDENRYHHYYDKQPNHETKRRLKEAFSPAHLEWSHSVVDNGTALFNKVKEYIF